MFDGQPEFPCRTHQLNAPTTHGRWSTRSSLQNSQRNAPTTHVRWSTRSYLQNSPTQSSYYTCSMVNWKFPAELTSATLLLHMFDGQLEVPCRTHQRNALTVQIWSHTNQLLYYHFNFIIFLGKTYKQ
jgi:hypothetical protein